MPPDPRAAKYDAVLFDLLSALLDSWSMWNEVAQEATGAPELGTRWRKRYLELIQGAGRYRPYEEFMVEAARELGLPATAAAALIARWGDLEPWPEAPAVLRALARHVPLAIVTNCSDALARQGAAQSGGTFAVICAAESVGWYKPDARAYRKALDALGVESGRVLYVAGSPGDVIGAAAVRMRVYWHDRLRLRRERADALSAATFTHASLHPLVAEVLGARP